MFSDIWLSNSQDRNAANFPRAILSVSRQECDRLPLTVKRGLSDDPGQLPDDLQGRLFVISPVGDLDSDTIGDTPVVLPSANGWTPLFNGDGMVYRLDFDSPGATWSAKIVKTPCYHADRATGEQERYRDLRFKNIGFGRLSYPTHHLVAPSIVPKLVSSGDAIRDSSRLPRPTPRAVGRNSSIVRA
jgi:hypothetical protein